MAESRAVVRVVNARGLHARPATLIVKGAAGFRARARMRCLSSGAEASSDSMISLLALGAAQGTEIEILSEGDEHLPLLNAMVALFDSGFGEEAE